MNKLQDYINSFEQDKENFIRIMNYTPNNDALKLFQWMMNSEYNQYSFFSDPQFGNEMSSLAGAVGMYQLINHALYDDGDITFVKTKSWPLICFYNRKENDFREVFMSEIKKSGHGNFVLKHKKPLSFINSVDEYIKEFDDYENHYQQMWKEYGIE